MSKSTIQADYIEGILILQRIHHRMHEAITFELSKRKADINSTQALMIYNLAGKAVTASELKTHSIYVGSNPTYNLKALAEKGYIDIERGRFDKRSITIRLSAKGNAVRNVVHEILSGQASMVEPYVGIADLAGLNATMQRLDRFWYDQVAYMMAPEVSHV